VFNQGLITPLTLMGFLMPLKFNKLRQVETYKDYNTILKSRDAPGETNKNIINHQTLSSSNQNLP